MFILLFIRSWEGPTLGTICSPLDNKLDGRCSTNIGIIFNLLNPLLQAGNNYLAHHHYLACR